MKVAITGSTGLVGSALVPFLTARGHDVWRVVRSRRPTGGRTIYWEPQTGVIDMEALEGSGAIVHLASEPVENQLWTAAKKRKIWQSRADATRLLVDTIGQLKDPPQVLLSASSVSVYGDRGDQVLDESEGTGAGFLSAVCESWEAEALRARGHGIRVVLLRFGAVLSPSRGALKTALLPVRLGLGGPLGSGDQYVSWVTLPDAVRAIVHLWARSDLEGAFNISGPEPVRNRDFVRSLGAELGLPTPLTQFRSITQVVLGEMAEDVLFASKRAVPRRLLESGFVFEHEKLGAALHDLLGSRAQPRAGVDTRSPPPRTGRVQSLIRTSTWRLRREYDGAVDTYDDVLSQLHGLGELLRPALAVLPDWIDLVESVLWSVERESGPHLSAEQRKARAVDELTKHFASEKDAGGFDYSPAGDFLSAPAGLSIEFVLRLVERNELWSGIAPDTPAARQKEHRAPGVRRRVATGLRRLANWVYPSTRAAPAHPRVSLASPPLSELPDDHLVAVADAIGARIAAALSQSADWLGLVDVVSVAVREAESQTDWPGHLKHHYATQLIRSFLREEGLDVSVEHAGTNVTDAAIGAIVDSVVRLFNKRGYFVHAGPGVGGIHIDLDEYNGWEATTANVTTR